MPIFNQTYAKDIEMRRIRMLFTYNECVNKYGSKYLVMFVEPHRIWILISSDIL